jgi:hypothetical protein
MDNSKTDRAAQKLGRTALWVTFPLAGFLRSREYGRRRQAELIAEALSKDPKPQKPETPFQREKRLARERRGK